MFDSFLQILILLTVGVYALQKYELFYLQFYHELPVFFSRYLLYFQFPDHRSSLNYYLQVSGFFGLLKNHVTDRNTIMQVGICHHRPHQIFQNFPSFIIPSYNKFSYNLFTFFNHLRVTLLYTSFKLYNSTSHALLCLFLSLHSSLFTF